MFDRFEEMFLCIFGVLKQHRESTYISQGKKFFESKSNLLEETTVGKNDTEIKQCCNFEFFWC